SYRLKPSRRMGAGNCDSIAPDTAISPPTIIVSVAPNSTRADLVSSGRVVAGVNKIGNPCLAAWDATDNASGKFCPFASTTLDEPLGATSLAISTAVSY